MSLEHNHKPEQGVQVQGFGGVAERAVPLLEAAGGGALCVYVDGRPAIDLWAGYKDPANRVPWERDTMAMAWSTTKGVASTAVHLLADRGLLRYDDLVSDHWPEFGVNGKENTTIRHVLAMEAGLYDIRHLIDDPTLMLNPAAMSSALAAAAPANEPGTRSGYHALTYGWLIGELVQRIAGVSIGSFVRSEIVEPLELDGCFIGTPEDQLHRVAAFPELQPERAAMRRIGKILNPMTSLFGVSLSRMAAAFFAPGGNEVIPTTEFLMTEAPSANGVFTARSLARLYAALGADDGVDGVRLWSPSTRHAVTRQQSHRRDLVLPIKMNWKLGYHPPFPKSRPRRKTAGPNAFGFYGAFGSGAFADPDRGLAVGLVVQEAKGFPLTKLVGPIVESVDSN